MQSGCGTAALLLTAVMAAGWLASCTAEAAAPDAAAGAPAAAFSGRRLQQLSVAAACNRAIPGCAVCTSGKIGTRTVTFCAKPQKGYQLKSANRACWCAPGYYWNTNGTDGSSCDPCGIGAYCPGARSTRESAVQIPCGQFKNTTSNIARKDTECLVNPGYGWGAGNGAYVCPQGAFNPGYNTRRCTLCPGGMTTNEVGCWSPSQCTVPTGYYYMRGKALPCARGTYKETTDVANSCEPCPEGFTTVDGAVGASSRNACEWVLPGYEAPPGAVLGTTPGTLCPGNTYRAGDGLYNNETGVACTPCPTNMNTTEAGCKSADACLAGPGYGYNSTSRDAYICPLGYYNPGWNRQRCIPCGGGNITSDNLGSVAPDDCKTPPGYMTYRVDGSWFTEICPKGQFGRDKDTYGQTYVTCATCPDFSTTDEEGSVNSSQCLTLPGYGWQDGGVAECEEGYWAAGHTQDDCTHCGYGHTTTLGGNLTGAPIKGATSSTDCVIDIGFAPSEGGGLKPCPAGFYKDAYGPTDCVQCPNSTTTTLAQGADALEHCDACLPGHGAASISSAAPACAVCASGFYSAGHGTGGKACEACPQAQGFSGVMVSRTGIHTPEHCFPEFTTDGASKLPWNMIRMDASALAASAASTLAACQAACAAIADCQYFSFDSLGPTCRLRNFVAYSVVDVNDTSKEYALFEAKEGFYAAYEAHPTDAASLGEPLSAYASLAAAKAACDAEAACVGIKSVQADAATPWHTFKGTVWEAVTAKVRVVGASINPWVADLALA